ncbi:unnamed protein product [Rhizoctonia solani]|uniref:Uncharacterized protein n=1 Tax=Rhizoctonia solani TaxID=456999 RepID=A0A8H3ECL1_9AGAM|nr:unnamed protein product [Rhizoctonia solani]
MTSLTRPRLSSMMQSSTSQRVMRRPTIGAPEVVLSQEPTASLKRRSHIRRTSRSGNSPTSPDHRESQTPSTTFRMSRQELTPLTTAFTRSVATSISSGSILSGRPICVEHRGMEWRHSPQCQPKVTSGTDISRRSTIASVYSLPSAGPHESRRPTQENFVVDWSFVDRALQNRVESPVASPPFSQPARDSPHRSYSIASQAHLQLASGPSLSRSDTTRVSSLILGRQQGRSRS